MFESDTDRMAIVSIDNYKDVEGESDYLSLITLAQVPLKSYYNSPPSKSKSSFDRQSEVDR